jgi:hypothetical protein
MKPEAWFFPCNRLLSEETLMFGIIDDVMEDADDSLETTLGTEMKQKVVSLAAAGLTIYEISETAGLASDIVLDIIDE